ncbi:DUF6671 family protein [Jeongeupia chitinilytica]|uniref:DUF6671 domain-containing protein n=1 Tax=Jeongeupia chitinilytica TaxID=1041641 RepID=A0ABQ3GYM8_9NEIS|nr:DUF6671 family protein [Jeongeupia chitinilytica]GHD56489.1 hypothetical protein GCM10007350_03760 [Jeongeupia chitinilytica]
MAASMPLQLKSIAGPQDGPELLIATMHGKESVLGPSLATLGFNVLLPLDYDTDALGTFSGDIRRPGTAFEAALEKARRACDATGVPRAVASEGSYRPCQTLFPGARNAELLAFVDRERGVEFVEYLTDLPTSFVKGRVPADPASPAARALLADMGWPGIRAMVVPHDPGNGVPPTLVFKGLGTEAELTQAFAVCAAHSQDGQVHLETDLRAHMNPTRMTSVALMGIRLIERLQREGYADLKHVLAA